MVCQLEPTEAAANIVVRREYLSNMAQRLSTNERVVRHPDHLLHGHPSDCALALSTFLRTLQSGQTQDLAHRANEPEELCNEDSLPNGMAMTFIEEHTAAFFGESSNMHFARLVSRAMARC